MKTPHFKALTILESLIFAIAIIGFSINRYTRPITLLLLPYLFFVLLKSRNCAGFYKVLLLLITFSITHYTILYFYGLGSLTDLVFNTLSAAIAFCLGYAVSRNDNGYIKTNRYIFLIISSMTLLAFTSLVHTQSVFGSVEDASVVLQGRSVQTLWGYTISATGVNAFFSYSLSLLPFILMMVSFREIKVKKIYRFISVVAFIMGIYGTMQLGNRTGFMIVIISTLAVILRTPSMTNKKRPLLALASLLALIVAMMLFQYSHVLNGTLLYERSSQLSLNDDLRYSAWSSALIGLFDYPMGGQKTLLPTSYAHNMWLDVGYQTGFAPLLLLLTITLAAILVVRRFNKIDHPIEIKFLINALFTASIIVCFVEPILQGWTFYFYVFCILLGVVYGCNSAKAKEVQL